jgi:hypothetical protein
METLETEPAGQLHAGAPERELRLAEGAVLAIGSAPDNDLGMGDPLLAPHHARIERMGRRLRLTDLGGGDVLVNDTPIGAAWLVPGDTVRIGRLRLTVGTDAVRYRDPAGTLLIGKRRARALPNALINNMAGFDGVPIEPAQPLPNPAEVSRPAVFAVLRRRNFTLLWLAQLISELGSGFTWCSYRIWWIIRFPLSNAENADFRARDRCDEQMCTFRPSTTFGVFVPLLTK